MDRGQSTGATITKSFPSLPPLSLSSIHRFTQIDKLRNDCDMYKRQAVAVEQSVVVLQHDLEFEREQFRLLQETTLQKEKIHNKTVTEFQNFLKSHEDVVQDFRKLEAKHRSLENYVKDAKLTYQRVECAAESLPTTWKIHVLLTTNTDRDGKECS